MGAPLHLDIQLFVGPLITGLTRRQLQAATSRASFIAGHPGRRSGKTYLIPRMALWACTRATGGDILLGAETKLKAKALFWAGLLEYVKGREGWQINGQEGWIRSPWGPTIRLWGIKDEGAIALLRGFSVVECHFDEVATYAHRLHGLIDDVIEPMLGEWRHYPLCGRCFLWGTPSPTRIGPWFEICTGKTPGWEVFHWTVHENEHYPDPVGYLRSVRERHGWDEKHPGYQREYLGRFVDDGARLVIAFSRGCLIDRMPADYDPRTWEHTLAVDFGLRHNSAWALIASDPKSKTHTSYLVSVRAASGLLQDAASAITLDYVQRHRVLKLVGDAHGLGAPYVEAWNRLELAPIRMEAAQKADKRGWIEVLNDDLRTGRLLVVKDACTPWVDEASSLPWNDDRTGPDPAYSDDAVHAAIYAFRHHRPFMTVDRTPPEERVSPEERITRALDEEALREQRRRQSGQWHDR